MNEETPEKLVEEAVLNRKELIGGLQAIGIDVEIGEWEDFDDNDILGHIATLAMMYDYTIFETFEALGIPVENIEDLE